LTLLSDSLSISLKSSNLDKSKDASAYSSNVQIMTQAEENRLKTVWGNLFAHPRTTVCSKTRIMQRINRKLKRSGKAGAKGGKKGTKNDFWWVKQWGYGPVAYFFDFLDPVLKKSVVEEFQAMHKELLGFPSESSNFSDVFDFKKMVSQDSSSMSKSTLRKLQRFTKNYDASVYDVSANMVQLRGAVTKWKWPVNPGDSSFYQRFITKYDMNYDGRLNPREFILGSIYDNPQAVGSSLCKHCFFDIGQLIDAIFLYVDCDNDGLISAEDMWHNLSNIKRKTEKWNIFSFGNDENIRTAAVNDFILKNMKIKNGKLTRKEFRTGILLGIWDRQTEKTQIISDDSRNMKNLRWDENDMLDVALYNYYKKKLTKGK
jgi:hypothetical protein